MKILFWNTHQNPNINQVICNIVWEKEIDIVSLAEYSANLGDLISLLSANDVFMQKYITVGCEKVTMLGRILNVTPGTQSSRYSIQIINGKHILCSMHLPSQLFGDEEDRKIVMQSIIHDVLQHEAILKTNYSILLGDFNEDPYDVGCVSANHFHGLPCRDDAIREKRVVQGNTFFMFYNPMWNLYGDFTSPPGTYYHTTSIAVTPFWHMFDQVMIRPSLIEKFIPNSFEIVTHAGVIPLLDQSSHPDKKYSDHLPIIFEIKEE